MIKYVKRFLFARKVCKKYGITFLPWRLNSWSPASYSYYYKTDDKGRVFDERFKIYATLFDKEFYSSLFHELGHYIDYKNTERFSSSCYNPQVIYPESRLVGSVNCDTTLSDYTNEDYRKLLVQEVTASVIAVKMMKSCGIHTQKDTKYLVKALETYTKFIDKKFLADYNYRLTNILRNT